MYRAYLYHADRSYALVLGRPYAIQDEYSTTQPPLNIEDLSSLSPTSPPVAPALSTPTRMTFVILRHKLAYLIGKMVHRFQRVNVPNHYSDVLALDDDLQRFVEDLPPHFSFRPDTSLDATEEYIPLHRYLLTTEILFVRISLHRPYLLRRLDSDKYARSRRACFEAALTDFEVRQAYRRLQPKEIIRTVSNAYREFQTAMISGMYLVLDPTGKDAEKMHTILDTFLKDHEGIDGLDDTTRRELKIIEFLKSKASQVERVSGRKFADQSMDAQASLLLNLQQSRNAKFMPPRSVSEGSTPTSGIHPSFSSLSMGPPPQSASPNPIIGPMPPPPSNYQRMGGTGVRHSPAGSGSPGMEDDSSAQSMLDNWCNAVTNPPPLLLDNFTNNALSGQWGTYANGIGDATNWFNSPYLLGGDGSIMNGVEGADYNYWENLVNQIRGGALQ